MEADPLSRALRIDSPEQASVFVNPKRRRILVQFMGRERSLSEAATALDMPLNRLAHHIGAFLKLGLLRITREQKRAGRPIRFYRAIADSIVVPAEMMRGASGDALAAELRFALAKAEHLSGQSDMMLSLDAEGRARMTRTGGERESDACEYWRVLTLGKREARLLALEFVELLNNHKAARGRGKAPYLVHIALAPRANGRG